MAGSVTSGDSSAERAIRAAVQWAVRDEQLALAAVEERMFGTRPLEPFRLSRYVVVGRLGRGAAGIVYRAYDPELDRAVAIKILEPIDPSALRTQHARERFVREARSVASFSHPNVIAIHDVGTFDAADVGPHLDPRDGKSLAGEGIFIVMELVEGETLRAWLRERHRVWRDVLRVFVLAGRGLAAAHAAGIVHRDFKPANVLLSAGDAGPESVKVADFGLAVNVDDVQDSRPPVSEADDDGERPTPNTSDRLTETGTVLGTPAFMAPEQHRSEDAQAASDQYAYCTALYQALFRRLPFKAANWTELYDAKIRTPLKFPDTNVPTWLRRVVARGLAPDPADRFPSMAALLEVLEADRGRTWRRLAGALTAAVGIAGLAWGASVALQPGVLELEIEADGAAYAVEIDAEAAVLDEDGRIEVSAGRHVIEVTAPDHARFVEVVDVGRGETQRLSIALEHDTGTLDLEVDPRGGIVLLDGVDRGSRLVDFPVDTGRHEVVVRHPGYYDRRFELELAQGQNVERFVSLERAVEWTRPLTGVRGPFAFVGDVDGDGFGDVMYSHFGELFLHDPWSGEQLWTEALPPSSQVWAENVDDDPNVEIVIASWTGGRLQVAAREGPLVRGVLGTTWSRRLPSPSAAGKAPVGDVAFVDLDGDGKSDVLAALAGPPRVVGMRGADGATLFEHRLREAPLAARWAPGPRGRRVYVLGPRFVQALDLDEGTEAWSVSALVTPHIEQGEPEPWERTGVDSPGRRAHLLTPLGHGDARPPDLVVLTMTGADHGRIDVREPEGGRVRWSATGSRWPMASPPLDFDGDGIDDVLLRQPGPAPTFELRSGASGELRWTAPAGLRGIVLIAVGDRALVLTTTDRALEALQWRDGEVRTVARRALAVERIHRAGDLDGDGRDELAVGVRGNSFLLLDEELQTKRSVLLPTGSRSIADPADANRDGSLDLLVDENGPTLVRGPKVRWSRGFTDAVRGAPVPYDANGDGRPELALNGELEGRQGFYVLAADTGELVVGPREKPGGGAIRGPAALRRRDGGTDFLAGLDHSVVRFRGEDGEPVGETPIPHSYTRPSVADVDGDGSLEAFTVDWGDGPGHVYVIDVETMTVERTLPLPRGGWGQPTVADFTGDGVLDVAATEHDGTVRVYDTGTWSEHWSAATGERLAFGVTAVKRVGGATDVAVSPGAKGSPVLYLSGRTGEVLWRAEKRGSGRSPPLSQDVDGDGDADLFAAGIGGVISRLTPDGDVRWSAEVIGVDDSPPNPSGPLALSDLDGDGALELLSGWEDGTLRVFSADDGALEWIFRTDGELEATPVAVDTDGDGILEVIVASHDRRVYCLQTSPKR